MSIHYFVTLELEEKLNEKNIGDLITSMKKDTGNNILKIVPYYFQHISIDSFPKEIIQILKKDNPECYLSSISFEYLNFPFSFFFYDNLENMTIVLSCNSSFSREFLGYDHYFMDFDFHIKLGLLICKKFTIKRIYTEYF